MARGDNKLMKADASNMRLEATMFEPTSFTKTADSTYSTQRRPNATHTTGKKSKQLFSLNTYWKG